VWDLLQMREEIHDFVNFANVSTDALHSATTL